MLYDDMHPCLLLSADLHMFNAASNTNVLASWAENQIRTEMKDQKISSNFSVPGCHISKPAVFFTLFVYPKLAEL